jgi:hypothetical protein
MVPPSNIANQSERFHGSIPRIIECLVVADTNTAAPVIAQRTKTSVMVTTISLCLAAHAMAHPTNIEASTCPSAIPSLAKNTYALK